MGFSISGGEPAGSRRGPRVNTPAPPTADTPQEATVPLARLIAFYLPQFHPIPANDRWWGAGFTEWANVVTARPLFRGHRQPRRPGRLGFYDLRLAETREAQAELARHYGISGFCYWHYWFHGRRLLERPFVEVLSSGTPDLPFCLAWANESWTRTWMGHGEILLEQTYSVSDDVSHARCLTAAFADRRYIRLHDRPLFLIYRPKDLPEPARTTDTIRETAVQAGLAEPFLLGINAWCKHDDCRALGFDGTVDFQPQLSDVPGLLAPKPSARGRLIHHLHTRPGVTEDAAARDAMATRRDLLPFSVYRTIFAGWDNTPRRGSGGSVILPSGSAAFVKHLAGAIRDASARPMDERIVFVNAWNEWAEGNYLEPDADADDILLRAVASSVSPYPPHRN